MIDVSESDNQSVIRDSCVSEWVINLETASGHGSEKDAAMLLARLSAYGPTSVEAASYARHIDAVIAAFRIHAIDYPAAVGEAISTWFDAQRAIGLEPTLHNMTIAPVIPS